ncbi:hypothetical protein QAD02_011466 [Eretmocerus hayati]|uniref:Uncharacterized protein n=1 Tax=Eretmocerus hayati TaxID=131215 RepID=A0ACC2NWU9_9HYME|nr:hypothetical protein QAD02_011466 [Eretmocerus hayati]
MDDLSDGRPRKRKQLSQESNSQSSGSPRRASFDKDKRIRRPRSASSGSSNGSRSPLAQVRRPMRGGRNGANPQGFDRRPRNFQNGDNNNFRRNDGRPFQQRNPQGRFPPNRTFDNQRFNRFDNRNGRNFPQRRDNQFGQRNFGDRNRNARTWDQGADNRRFPNQRPMASNWNRGDRGTFNRRPQDRNRFATGDRWKQNSSNERYGHSRSPMRSPMRSPHRSPSESPRRSPHRSPERSPYQSPHRSPIRSPPRKSPPRSIDLPRMKEDRIGKDHKAYEDRGKVDKAPVLPPEPLQQSVRAKAMAPMSKKDWDKRQTVIRRIYDEASGRHRLIKGDGEVVEEIVSRDRHKQINSQATRADGEYFQSQLRKK